MYVPQSILYDFFSMQNRLTACGFSFLEPAPGGNVFYDFVEAKIEEKLNKL